MSSTFTACFLLYYAVATAGLLVLALCLAPLLLLGRCLERGSPRLFTALMGGLLIVLFAAALCESVHALILHRLDGWAVLRLIWIAFLGFQLLNKHRHQSTP